MKYIKLFEDSNMLKKDDKALLINSADFAIKHGFEIGGIYTVGKTDYYSSNSIFLLNDIIVGNLNGLWFSNDKVIKATPSNIEKFKLEQATKKYNLI